MPYEVYIVPQNQEMYIDFMLLMPGQTMGITSYDNGDVEAIAIHCSEDDSSTEVFKCNLGSRELNHVVHVPKVTSEKNLIGSATQKESNTQSFTDEKNVNARLVIRYAGKAALKPTLN